MEQLKKRLALVVIAALLLAGCTPAAPTTPNETPPSQSTAPTVPVQTDEPTQPPEAEGNLQVLTAGMAAEIETAWLAATGTDLGNWFDADDKNQIDGVRYYGTYADYQIIFRPNGDDAITELKIENVTFSHNIGFELYAYRDGNFISLKKLVEQGTLSIQELGLINLRHRSYELQPSEGFVQLPTVTDGLYDTFNQMKLAFLRQNDLVGEHTIQELSVTYYGEYGGAHVGFINGILMYTQALTSETVAGVTFRYNSGQKMLVYVDGELMRLGEAYDRGLLTQEDLITLHSLYTPKDDSFATE